MSFNIVKRTISLAIALVMLSSTFTGNAAVISRTSPEVGITEEVPGEEIVAPSVVVVSTQNTLKGVQIAWEKTEDAVKYGVYKINNGTEEKLTDTEENVFVDENVESGSIYTYIVKALDAEGNATDKVSENISVMYVGVPTVKSFKNTVSGTKIYWTECKGAAKYELVYLDAKNGEVVIEVTSELNCLHDGLKSGENYSYKVRCLDEQGNPLNEYSEVKKNRFIAPIKISGISNDGKGVSLKWKKVAGASKYKVYKKEPKSSWKELAVTSQTTYTDKKVKSNTKYSYSIVALDSNKNPVSVRNLSSSIKYIEAPKITKFVNLEKGTAITWTKSAGASKYRIYAKVGNGKWNYLATVTGTSYTHKKLVNGTTYSYKVRCLDSKNNFISGAKEEKSNLFIAPIKVTGVSKTKKGTLIKWNGVNGAEGYRVFRKVYGGKWIKIGEVSKKAQFTDTSAKKDVVYGYSVRAINKKGYIKSAYVFNGEYYRNGKIAAGIVGSQSTGYFYADKNGKINYNYVNGVEQNGVKWIVINGKATKVSTRSDQVLFRAAKEVAKCTNTSMTKQEKLWAAFRYCQTAYKEKRPRTPHYLGVDWPIIYAEDMFVRDGGNCCSYAAAFAYMAKAIGYTQVYCCNSGGHGWAEIDGRIYDPEWGRHYKNYTYFGLDYNEIRNPNYKGAIAAKKDWMYVKI